MLKIIVLFIVIVLVAFCMGWTMIGEWKGVAVPLPIRIANIIAMIGLLTWIIWRLAQEW